MSCNLFSIARSRFSRSRASNNAPANDVPMADITQSRSSVGQQPRKLRRDILDGPIAPSSITVVVGRNSDTQTFILPEHQARQSSTFFNECLSRPCKEQLERIIRLPSVSGETFRIYAQFLRTGELYMKQSDDPFEFDIGPALPASTPPTTNQELVLCVRMYRLAHMIEATDFKDATSDAIVEIMTEFHTEHPDIAMCMPEDSVQYVYHYSEAGAAIRRLIVDWAVVSLDHGLFDLGSDRVFERGFKAELAARLREIGLDAGGNVPVPNPFGGLVGCEYHEHVREGKGCYREKYLG